MSHFDSKDVLRVARASTKPAGKRRLLGSVRRLADDVLKPNGETVRISYDAKVQTANWQWDASSNWHKIVIGMGGSFDDWKLNASTRVSRAKQVRLIKAVIEHECNHAEFTHDSSDKTRCSRVVKEFADKGYPFGVFNLFEDAYIEFKHWKTYGTRKGWTNFIDNPRETLKAVDFLYALKVSELGSKKTAPSSLAPKWTGSFSTYVDASIGLPSHKSGPQNTTKLIVWFYRQVCKLDTIEERAELAEKWIKVFGSETPPQLVDMGDSSDAHSKTGNSYNPNAGNCDDQDQCKAKEWNRDAAYQPYVARYESDTESVVKRARRLATAFEPIKQRAQAARSAIGNNGSRLHIRNAIIGAPNAFKRVSKDTGKRNLIALVDMSGSMAEPWLQKGGREFVTALRIVDEMGIANVQLIYSCSSKRSDLSSTKSSMIAKTGPNGSGEGLRKTVDIYKSELKEADVALVFTDGAITDGDCNFSDLRGITQLIGAMIADKADYSRYSDRMRESFSSFVICSSVEELARRIASLILNA